MEILNLKEKIDTLYNRLIKTSERLADVEKSLKSKDIDVEEFEHLYAEEFELSMEIMSLYDDIHLNLERLEAQDPKEKFYIKRLNKEIKEYVRSEVIDL